MPECSQHNATGLQNFGGRSRHQATSYANCDALISEICVVLVGGPDIRIRETILEKSSRRSDRGFTKSNYIIENLPV